MIGSIAGSLDAASGTLTKFGYQPFGENPSLTAGGYRYTARRLDPETLASASQPSGLYYYRARMYAPGWGRFFQADPSGYPAGTNLYAYVGNDPLNLVDPFGLTPDSPSFGQSLTQASINSVPGAYYAGLAQQQFQQGNYASATVYGTASAVDAAVAVFTAGLGTKLESGLRAAEEGGLSFFRGARLGSEPSFVPRPGEFKVDPVSGFVKDTRGVSVFNNPGSVSSKGFVPYEVEQGSIPSSLRIIQRGADPSHFEIVPTPGANLTPEQFINACASILCVK